MTTLMTARPDRTKTPKALSITLAGLGVISATVALNVAFGGLRTLGLQGPTDFVRIANEDAFLIRDSHAHYYGGVYLALGLFLVYASTNVARFRQALYVIFAMIFAGGVARLTQFEPGVTFGHDLLVSTAIELVGVPLLALWVARSTRSDHLVVEDIFA